MDKRLLVKREGEFSYPICFTRDFSKLSQVLKEEGFSGRRCLVITDSVVEGLYLKQAISAIEEAGCPCGSITFPAGEEHKTLQAIQDFYKVLLEGGYDRSCFLAALGGGVCGDMTGFTAATYLRGVDFIQLPTTLLAQVDSSVGGKTGVDYLSYKNMVGAFHQPRLVYMAMDTLKTLPDEQFSSGMGEVLKTGLICDRDLFFDTLKQKEALLSCSYEALTDVIYRCIQIKAMIVERDPKEKGERALLNLGHTIGHGIEACS
ncbi:MAG: 3-dehydroquinate synthase, partial [Blautia sp.]|nr:3-dehydroquinate synthase [Blautia sp.]